MSDAIDPRIVRVSIQVGGDLKVYEGLDIKSTGTKFANPLQNEAQVDIANLTQSDRDYFLTATSPYNKDRTPKLLILEAGRQSYGTTRVYAGNISSVAPSQPADITLRFKCKTNQFLKGQMVATTQPSISTLRKIATQAAKDAALQLTFEATDKNITNYNFTGPVINQVGKLSDLGELDVWADDTHLYVKDAGVPLKGQQRVVDVNSGMVGIPTLNEQGMKVTYMLDNTTVLGGSLRVVSILNPPATGDYCIYKLGWNITSRDIPFYWIAEALRLNDQGQAVVPLGVKKKKGKKGKFR